MYINQKLVMLCSIFVLILLLTPEANAQSNTFSVQWSGGVSYLPFRSLRQYYEQLSTEDIHFTVQPNAASAFSLGMQYDFSLHHSVSLTVNYVESRPVMRVVFTRPVYTYMEIPDVRYDVQMIPFTFGYRYTFNKASFTPFAGIGISYLYTSIDKRPDYTSDIRREQARQDFSKTTFAGEAAIGVIKTLVNKWDAYSQITYLYSPRLKLQEESIDFAGLSLLFGLQYNIGRSSHKPKHIE